MTNTYINMHWAAVAALLLGICNCSVYDDKNIMVEGISSECFKDANCEKGEFCVFQRCSVVCEPGQDCANGAICLQIGRGGACTRIQDNACVTDAECPEAMKCIDRRCLNKCDGADGALCWSGSTCVDGVCRVNGSYPGLTDAGGATYDANKTDGPLVDSETTPAGNKAEQTCPPNSAQCRGDKLVNCDAHGNSQPEQTCAFVCSRGKCTGVCKPAARRCDGQVLQNCDGAGEWKALETCAKVCTPAGCSDGCNDGERLCNGPTVMSCKNGQMVEEQKCPYVCSDNACAGQCVPGTGECLGNFALTCNAEGQWGIGEVCWGACANGVCGDCAPGDIRCGDNRTYQVCRDNGQWGDSINCSNQACVQGSCVGECTPGTTKCENGSIRLCGTFGTWGQATACVVNTCVEDRCEGECTPGSKKCANSSSYSACGSDGRWATTACAANEVCTNTECEAVLVCSEGNSPDWYAGRDGALNDARWGLATGTAFASSRWNRSGTYRILLDRAPGASAGQQGELVVSIRAASSANDTASTSDYVYFGVGAADGSYARAITVPLIAPTTTAITDPKALLPSTFQEHEYKASGSSAKWSHTKSISVGWIESPVAWIESNSGVSWAVGFRVNLQNAGIVDSQKPFRAAVGIHIARASSTETELTTPSGSLDELTTTTSPENWPQVTPLTNICITHVTLAQ